MTAKTWAGDKGTNKVDTFWFDPDDVVIVADPSDPSGCYRKSAHHKPRKDLLALFGAFGWIESSIVVLRKDGDRFLVEAGNDRVISLREYNRLAREEGKEPLRMLCARGRGGPEQVTGVVVGENMGRRIPTPSEQAEAWGRLIAIGKSDREIAAMDGVPLAEVRARLAILETSPTVRAKIDSGELPPSAAPALARKSSSKQEEIVAKLPPKAGVREVLAAVKQDNATAKAEKEGKPAPVVRSAPKTSEVRALIRAMEVNPDHGIDADDALRWALGDEMGHELARIEALIRVTAEAKAEK